MIAAESALSANVLLLNRLYMAVRVVSARRALTLLYRELAEVVSVDDGQYLAYDFNDWVEVSQAKRQFEPERYDWVRTVRFQIAVPKIIRLLRRWASSSTAGTCSRAIRTAASIAGSGMRPRS